LMVRLQSGGSYFSMAIVRKYRSSGLGMSARLTVTLTCLCEAVVSKRYSVPSLG
jgi:hypothetical protein